MADGTLSAERVRQVKWPFDRNTTWLISAATIGLILWFMPAMPGLSVTGQHALAVVLFTVLLWVSGAMPTGASSLLMIAIVLCFMPEVKPSVFLGFWTSDTMWFVVVCFIFSAVLETSGLGRRLTVYVFSIRKLIFIDLALLGVNALFSVLGMNLSFPKLTLLFPLITSLAAMSSMPKDDPYVRHLAIMVNVLANTTGALVYSGFVSNPALGPLGGFSINYVTWLEWFFVPALVYTLISFTVIYFVFMPPRGEHFDHKLVAEQLGRLGPVSKLEWKAVAWLAFALALWITGPTTGIATGYAAALVAAGLMLPGIGIIPFKEYVQKTDWNSVFMLMGILAIGTLGSTGFARWIWSYILPDQMPANHMVSLVMISGLIEILHVPLGSILTTTALAVPSLAEYAASHGMSRILVSFVTYMSIVGQFFFVYQNASLVVGIAYGLWKPWDILKLGLIMAVVTPITFGVILYPWWMYMGWVQ
jgi:sodium-dependent dicarboxylate transporter 2/3/5